MENLKNTALFNMNETIASDIFKDTTYPWEVLSKISDFILTLGATLSPDEYEKKEIIYGLRNLQKLLLLLLLTDLPLLEKMLKSVIVHLSVETQSWEKVL